MHIEGGLIMRKSWLGVCIAAVSLICGATNAYAGQWIQEGSEWKYQRAMGDFIHHRSFSSSGSLGSIVLDDSGYSLPFYIDGNGDGIAESYVFDDNGYMVRNVTSGYVRVNSEGFCVDSDGKVYTKKVPQGVIDPTIGRGLIKQEIIRAMQKKMQVQMKFYMINFML